MSNVALFRNAYNDGTRHYVTGVGTLHRDRTYGDIVPPPLDRGLNSSGPDRIFRMLTYLMLEADGLGDDNAYLDIDIVGFSRGAAQARDFANLVAEMTDSQGRFTYDEFVRNRASGAMQHFRGSQCVRFRFMGLFDTVLSVNNSGRAYQLGIPARFEHVAHAVALNEYRGSSNWSSRNPLPGHNHWGAFPLESIGASSNEAGAVRIEMGFIGAHADIGGGYSETDNQLSAVALHWMVAQAQIAGVDMNRPTTSLPILDPVIHDQSNAIRVGDPRRTDVRLRPGGNGGRAAPVVAEDRDVRAAESGTTQRTITFGNGSMTNAQTHGFISYLERDVNAPADSPLNPRNLGQTTGTVDIAGYMGWLREHGYCFTGDTCAQATRP